MKTCSSQISCDKILYKQQRIPDRKQISPVSLMTVRPRLRETELKNSCAPNKIYIMERNQADRVAFAQQYVNEPAEMWDKAVVSDEKSF
mgnify:CR=1 FL=1